MKTKVKLISLFLSLTLLLSAIPVKVFASGDEGNTTLLTSFCGDDHLELSVSGSKLTISGSILCSGLEKIGATCSSKSKSRIDLQVKTVTSGRRFSVSLSLSGDEDISVSIYTFLKGETQGSSYEWGRILLEKQGSTYAFKKSAVSENNDAFRTAWVNPADYKGLTVSKEVQELSDSIVGSMTDDYAKCFKLNKWVAENIYYDMDWYQGNASTTPLSIQDVLLSHKSICAGYAALLTELLLAQGIPAFSSSVYALGVSSSGGSFAGDKQASTEPNHAIVEAFVNGRWVIMDPTWDSNNTCENNQYTAVAPNGYYYFDITPEALALDHQYFERGPITMANGQTVNATEASHIPSTWAQELIYAAMGEGIVPDVFQKYYTSPISRASMCRLAVEMIQKETGKTISDVMRIKKVSTAKISFADTTDSNVLACKALGIVDGVGKDSSGKAIFKPEASLTRAQAAVIASKLASVLGVQTSGFESDFPDVPATHWCAPFVGWASAANIVSGKTDGSFDPDGVLTLEQAIIIIYKTMKAAGEQE